MSDWKSLEAFPDQQRMLFDRWQRLIEGRAKEVLEWRKLFGAVLVGSNATALAASLTFISAVVTKDNRHDLILLAIAPVLFLFGFVLSVVCLAFVCYRARQTLATDCRYLQHLMTGENRIHWDTNPALRDTGREVYILTFISGVAAGLLFVIGATLFMLMMVIYLAR